MRDALRKQSTCESHPGDVTPSPPGGPSPGNHTRGGRAGKEARPARASRTLSASPAGGWVRTAPRGCLPGPPDPACWRRALSSALSIAREATRTAVAPPAVVARKAPAARPTAALRRRSCLPIHLAASRSSWTGCSSEPSAQALRRVQRTQPACAAPESPCQPGAASGASYIISEFLPAHTTVITRQRRVCRASASTRVR